MFGGSVPTLRKVIESSGETKMPSVQPTSTVREASLIMAKLRKGVLVMDGKGSKSSKSSKNDLVGIFTPKDLLSRVIAKGLNPDETTVSQVMTPNPDSVSADLTLLDALKEMHDQKFLHLPVRESSGKVIGLVDVMDLVSHSAGEGGGKGWRDFFSGAMAARGDGDESETASENSNTSGRSKGKNGKGSVTSGTTAGKKDPGMERPVSKLRPKAPTTATDSQSIYDVAVKMAANRVDAALLLDESGSLSGIITDNDITRRVVSQNVDVSGTKVDSVMTRNPKCVHAEDSALDALEMMVDNRFRHLPVLDKNDAVVGLLDIAKCLYDAISILEKVQEKEENGGDAAAVMAAAMTTAMKATAGKRGNNAAQLEMMQMLMSQMFGGSVPTLRK
eukprot:gene29485-38032_t